MSDNSSNSKKSNELKNGNGKLAKNSSNSSSSSLFYLSVALNAALVVAVAYLAQRTYFSENCTDYFRAGYRYDGIYEIWPTRVSDKRFNVYCNMTAGGWTAIFKRGPHSKVEFQLGIEAYKHGFGDLNNDHFLGLDNIHLLTRGGNRELMMVVNSTMFRYKNFQVMNEYAHYKLVIEDEIDQFIDGCTLLRLNNTLFSTIDVDFDLANNSSCSNGWKGGWWFTDCFDHSLCLTCMIMHGNSGVKKVSYAAMLVK